MSLVAKQAFACWFVALALIIAALFLFLGPPKSPDGASEAFGRVFAHTGIAAGLCWFVARRKTPPWSWGRFVLVYVAMVFVLTIVANAGRAHASDAPAGWMQIGGSETRPSSGTSPANPMDVRSICPQPFLHA